MPNSKIKKNWNEYLKINWGIFELWLDIRLGKQINSFIKNNIHTGFIFSWWERQWTKWTTEQSAVTEVFIKFFCNDVR